MSLANELLKVFRVEGDEVAARESLRTSLQKWKNDEYFSMQDGPPLLAFALQRKYTTTEFIRGLKGLEDDDFRILTLVIPVAKDLGFTVYVGTLNKTQKGTPQESGGCQSGDDEDVPLELASYDDEKYEIAGLVPICGGFTELKGMSIKERCIIGGDVFIDAIPDRCDYDEDTDTLTQWFSRSVMILSRNEDDLAVHIFANGQGWILAHIKSDPPTEASRFLVAVVLEDLKSKRRQSSNVIACRYKFAQELREQALRQSKADLWNQVVGHCDPSFGSTYASVVKALEVFQLENIEVGLYELVCTQRGLSQRFAIIDAIEVRVRNDHKSWLGNLRREAASTYTDAVIEDVPVILQVMKTTGATFIKQSILPNLSNAGNYPFLISLICDLQAHRTRLQSSTSNAENGCLNDIRELMRQSMVSAMQKWQSAERAPASSEGEEPANTIRDLVDLCCSINEPDLCTKFYDFVKRDSRSAYTALFEFAKALEEQLVKLGPDPSAGETRKAFTTLACTALQVAIPKWEYRLFVCLETRGPNPKTTRICKLVTLCCNLGDYRPCAVLFNQLIQGDWQKKGPDLEDRFREIYTPLVPHLKATLAQRGAVITIEPFRWFFQQVVSLQARAFPDVPGFYTPEYGRSGSTVTTPATPAIEVYTGVDGAPAAGTKRKRFES